MSANSRLIAKSGSAIFTCGVPAATIGVVPAWLLRVFLAEGLTDVSVCVSVSVEDALACFAVLRLPSVLLAVLGASSSVSIVGTISVVLFFRPLLGVLGTGGGGISSPVSDSS